MNDVVFSRPNQAAEVIREMLNEDEAIKKRDELTSDGYTLVPGVMKDPFLSEVREWTEAVFDRVEVDPKYRYQGSDVHVSSPRSWPADREQTDHAFPDPIVQRISDLPEAKQVRDALMLEGVRSNGGAILLSKPPFGPPLYWHQDHMNWNHPESAAPWPIKVFLSYYMTDTTPENGCLRVLPGTHIKRIPMHDMLPNAHEPEIQAIDDLDHPVFQDHPDAVDVPLKAGDLVIADSRMLHAAHANQTDQRRTLVLLWHDVFPYPSVPSWWEGEVPKEIGEWETEISLERTRRPGEYLK